MIDERDENFREMAALGNIKAVRAYIRSGVDTDGQNKMNGWTALHWACARGQADTVETLLRAGASTSIRNNKGHSALDVCKSESIRALFSSYVRNGESIGSDEEVSAQGDRTAAISAGLDGSFVPNYLANPDLMKTWGMPEDLLPPTVQGDSGYTQKLHFEASVGGSSSRQKQPILQANIPLSSAPAVYALAAASNERELLVYREKVDETSLLGSVFASNDGQTVAELGSVIRDELDGVPGSFVIARYNGKQTVPLSAKQESFTVGRVFRGAEDAVVVVKPAAPKA